jgi:hypothetical protein
MAIVMFTLPGPDSICCCTSGGIGGIIGMIGGGGSMFGIGMPSIAGPRIGAVPMSSRVIMLESGMFDGER